MPDLGQYAPYVLSSWGVVVLALSLLTGWILYDGRRLKRRLAAIESRGREPAAGREERR